MSEQALEQRLMSAFGQGAAAERRGDYRADNPHMPSDLQYDAWLAGFEHEEGPRYVARAA